MKTTTEAQLREWLAAGRRPKQVAIDLGCHVNDVYAAIRLLGLRSLRLKGSLDEVVSRLEQGVSATEVARAFNVKPGTLHMALSRAGLPTSPARAMQLKLQRMQSPDFHPV